MLIVTSSRRRCALCFALNDDHSAKPEGQIAHIDRDASNAEEDNLAWLCLSHHNAYDSKPSQSKGFLEEELKEYKRMLVDLLSVPSENLGRPSSGDTGATRPLPLSMPVYERKYAIYQAAIDLIGELAHSQEVSSAPIHKFAANTHEAIFLFEDPVIEFLARLHKLAVAFYVTSSRLSRDPPDDQREGLIAKDLEQINGLMEAQEEARVIFRGELRL